MNIQSPTLRFVDEVFLAEYLKLDRRTLQQWRLRGIGPKYRKFGNAAARSSAVRYDMADVQEWIEAQAEGGGKAAA